VNNIFTKPKLAFWKLDLVPRPTSAQLLTHVGKHVDRRMNIMCGLIMPGL